MTNITTKTQNKYAPSELKTSFQQSHSDKAETYLYQVQSSGATLATNKKTTHTRTAESTRLIPTPPTATQNKYAPSELRTSFQQSHSDKAETYLYQVQSSEATNL
jgi:hypothetical protein